MPKQKPEEFVRKTDGRFHTTPFPELMPGHCFTCRIHEAKAFVDLRLDLEYEDYFPTMGAVYICYDCIAAMADLLGFSTPEQTEKLKNIVARAESREIDYAKRIGKLEHVVDSLSDLVRDVPGVDDVLAVLDENPQPAVEPTNEPVDAGESGTPTDTPEPEQRPAKPNPKQGLGDLFETEISIGL